MRLLSLQISNFRVLKAVELEFPEKVIAIVGKNGAGKSSIIEAVSWALYGNQASRSGKDEIKSAFASESENCEVKVSFFINEEKFTVIRRLVGKSNRAEVELFRGEKSESVGVNETKSHVGNLLGLDWKGFLSSFLARQSELNALSDLVPSKRKDHIAGMLGIEKLDTAIQLLKQDTKLYKEKNLFLERTLSEKDTIDKFVKELQDKLMIIQSQLDPQVTQYDVDEKKLADAKSAYEQYTAKKTEFEKAETAISAQKNSLEIIQKQNKNLQVEKSNLAEVQSALDKHQKEHESLQEVPQKLEKLKLLQSNKKYANDLQNQLKEIVRKIKDYSELNLQLSQKLREIEKKYAQFPEKLASNLEKEKTILEEKRAQFSSLKTEIGRLEEDIKKLKLNLSNISTLKGESVCDRCHRPLGDDFESIKLHISEEISVLEKELESKSQLLQTVLKDGEKFKESTQRLEKQLNEQMLLKPEIETVKKELIQFQNRLQESETQKVEIQKKITEIGEVQFDEDEFQKLFKQNDQFEQIKTSISRFKGQLERLPNIELELTKLSDKISAIKQTTQEEIKTLQSIGYSVEEFEEKTTAYNKAQSIFEETKTNLYDIKKEQEITEISLKEKQNQQEMFKKSEKEFEETKMSHYYGEKLSSLFTLYRHDLIASIRPTLADLSSRLFNEMTDNKYNLVEVDEKYDLRVMDNGQFYGVERFSGGEKDLANLCLRLAISLSLTESAGLNRSFVILDEVFGSQDRERKDLILSALANLKNRFPQIILITHIEDIKDGVEQVIEVKQTDMGYSEVVVHGS